MIHLTFEKNKLWNCVYNQYKGIWSVLNESSINSWTPYFVSLPDRCVCVKAYKLHRACMLGPWLLYKVIACGSKDFLYLSLWQQCRSSLWGKVICHLSAVWWRGCWSLSMMDKSLFSLLLTTTFSKDCSLRPGTEPAFLMILSRLLVALVSQNTTAKKTSVV